MRQRIISGEYRPEDMLPSENELAALYKTSRVTVRKSLDVLQSEGLVKPWHGKGYFVLPPKYTTFTLYFGDTAANGRFRFQEVNIIRPTKEVAGMLQLKKHQMAIVTRRILERDGSLVAYDEKFIPYERGVPSIEFELHFAEFRVCSRSASRRCRCTPKWPSASKLPPPMSQSLGLKASAPLLVISRLIRANDGNPEGKPVGYGKQYLTESFGKLTAKSGYYIQGKL